MLSEQAGRQGSRQAGRQAGTEQRIEPPPAAVCVATRIPVRAQSRRPGGLVRRGRVRVCAYYL